MKPSSIMLSEAKKLYDLGFAIHWCRPKSKQPVEMGWTKGARKSWKELEKSFRPGMNMGVRLGSPSVVNGGYLAVIDCDVKGEDKNSRKEMEERLSELFPDPLTTAIVESGRSNGSCHYYIVTSTPVIPQRLAQADGKIKIRMPSVSASKHEKETLTDNELNNGIRLRAAWEISLMGEGQQVVLPPSIHPDSGKNYEWVNHAATAGVQKVNVMELRPKLNEVKKQENVQPVENFTEEEVSLEKLTKEDQDLIIEGAGSSDRSAEIFSVAMKMLKRGYSQNQILNVLSDEFNYLGQCAYDHTKSSSRARAVAWLREHTLKKAVSTMSAAREFDTEVEVRELGEAEAAKQIEEITKYGDWRDSLQRSGKGGKGPIKVNFFNTKLVLENSFSEPLIRRDLFSHRDTYNVNPPWKGRKGDEIRDVDSNLMKNWIVENYKFEPTIALINEVITVLASKNSFHPVRDYLSGLEWDGVPRINTWLKDYLGAEGEEPYLSAVSRKILCAAVARVMRPGVKFDHILIMEGKQGYGKSSACRILASEKWFCDNLPDIRDKDSRLNLVGAWIVEVGELATLKRADSEAYKAFFSAQQDRVRAPYGRKFEDTPRQCIFIGTTNADDYLRDRTGNRRFWPVVVGRCKFKELAKVRDQLFAEARDTWELGEELYLNEEENLLAEKIQESKIALDDYGVMEHNFLEFLEQQNDLPEDEKMNLFKVSIPALFSGEGVGANPPFGNFRPENYKFQLAARILSAHGFVRVRIKGRTYYRQKFVFKAKKGGEVRGQKPKK